MVKVFVKNNMVALESTSLDLKYLLDKKDAWYYYDSLGFKFNNKKGMSLFFGQQFSFNVIQNEAGTPFGSENLLRDYLSSFMSEKSGGGSILTNGKGTTANGTSIDLGGNISQTVTYNYNIDRNETHGLYTNGDYIRTTRMVRTIPSTTLPLTVFSYNVPDGEAIGIRVVCTIRRADSVANGRFESKVRYIGNMGGVLNTPATATDFLSQSYAVSFDIVTSGTTANVNITTGGGILDWLFDIEIYKVRTI